jgi:hypothetical protein
MHFIYMAMMSMRTDRQLKGLPGAFSADVCSWTYSNRPLQGIRVLRPCWEEMLAVCSGVQ